MSQAYDIIGDTHGRADALEALLAQMGYVEQDGVYAHPEGRKVVFLGDFVDKGPQQKRTVQIVRSMVEAGKAHAVMGNHEFNAICYAQPSQYGGFVRDHNEMHAQQHQKFLSEFEQESDEYNETIAWFKTLPVYLDLPDFRVVHACWDDDSIAALAPYLNEDKSLIEQAYEAYGQKEDPFFSAFDSVVKGPEVKLPNGISYTDDNGHERSRGRLLWWSSPQTPNSEKITTGKKPMDEGVARAVDMAEKLRVDFMLSSKPTFIGHYFLHGPERKVSSDVTLLDYRGQVTGYRWESGDDRSRDSFIAVPSNAY